MGKVSDKSCRENENIDFILNNSFSFGKSCLFEIMLKNMVESHRSKMTT
jgi:hypothetical protein